MSTKFAEDLELLDSEHDPSKVKYAEKAPDGEYQARLDVCRLGRSKKDNLQTYMKFEIVHGEHEGRILEKYAQMSTNENLDYLTKDIWNILGDKVPFKWKEIEDLYEKMLDTIVNVTAKTDPDVEIQNVFVNKKITKLNGKKQEKKKDDLPF